MHGFVHIVQEASGVGVQKKCQEMQGEIRERAQVLQADERGPRGSSRRQELQVLQ